MQVTRSHYRKRSNPEINPTSQPKQERLKPKNHIKATENQRVEPIKKVARNSTMPLLENKLSKARKATKMVSKIRTSVGITKKPTSTNRKEMMLKVKGKTSISKREETGRETKRATEEEDMVVKRKAQERSVSRPTQSKMMKTEEREETQEARVQPTRSERDLEEVVPSGIMLTHTPKRGRGPVQQAVKEACHQWSESSMTEIHTCHLIRTGARTTSM